MNQLIANKLSGYARERREEERKKKGKKKKKKKGTIYAGVFNCRVPLKMLEKCAKCPKEGRCKYSKGLLLQLIRDKKTLSYRKPD